jgi:hypothetical protein
MKVWVVKEIFELASIFWQQSSTNSAGISINYLQQQYGMGEVILIPQESVSLWQQKMWVPDNNTDSAGISVTYYMALCTAESNTNSAN